MGLDAELFYGPLATGNTEGLASGRILEQSQQGLRQDGGIPGGNQEASDPIHNNLRCPSGRRCHNGFGHRHGFEKNPTAGFGIGREHADIRSSQEWRHVATESEETDCSVELQCTDAVLQRSVPGCLID